MKYTPRPVLWSVEGPLPVSYDSYRWWPPRVRQVQLASAGEQDVADEVRAAIRAWALEQYDKGELPHTQAFFGRGDPAQALAEVIDLEDADGRFERGLATLLEGVAHSRAGRARPISSWSAPLARSCPENGLELLGDNVALGSLVLARATSSV